MSKPLVATYWLLTEGSMPNDPSVIPPEWKFARFDTADILFVVSFFVLPRQDPATGNTTYKFGLQDGEADNGWLGRYENRYKWVVAEARTQNPRIRIIAGMMMHTDSKVNPLHIDDLGVLQTPESRTEFATSVKELLLEKSKETYLNSAGVAVPARIDGFDIDLEDGNLQPYLPEFLAKQRSAFDSVGPSQKLYLSVTPAWTDCLDNSCPASLDYLNMQNYDGGRGTSPEDYRGVMPALQYAQMLWGMSLESPGELNTCTSVGDAVGRCKNLGLGGVMTWRLNSSNWVYQEMLQIQLYAEVKDIAYPVELGDLVSKGWQTGGKDADGNPISPWTEQDWIANGEWRGTQ
ncbi:hypothetical protein LA080_003051 [Diaporthe eres]|uniref:Chitinase n=1 Tax=Diaporthe vaccinii TaxID=105482 RepID=A0ABR4EUM0_9PEZI|nr:hypothetical protein LA080_003051 [Diaporthe eres]